MTANPLRGEVTITLDGEEYPLRPAHEAIVIIEEKTGKSLQQLAIAADGGALSLREMAIVVAETAGAYGRANSRKDMLGWKPERVQELLFDAGIMSVQPRVSFLLVQALTGGHKPGEAEAAGTTMTTTESTPAAG